MYRQNPGHFEIINIKMQIVINSGWFWIGLWFNFTLYPILYLKLFYDWHLLLNKHNN